MALVLQATSFALSSEKVQTELMPKPHWLHTAIVFNEDGSVLDMRAGWNDFDLVVWLASFGLGPDFREYYERTILEDLS